MATKRKSLYIEETSSFGVDGKYVEIVAHALGDVVVCRRRLVVSEKDILYQIESLVSEYDLKIENEFHTIYVNSCSEMFFRNVHEREVHFTNICGKIVHWYSPNVIKHSVMPLTFKINNNFGRFWGLYGPTCNLITSNNMSNTIFKAARSTSDVSTVISHALESDSIRHVVLHMIVASARICNPICLQSMLIDKKFQNDSRWTANTVVKTEEGAHMKSISIVNINKEWIVSHDKTLIIPPKILVNMTKHGGVNIFLSLPPDVTMENEVEKRYLFVYHSIIELIEKYT